MREKTKTLIQSAAQLSAEGFTYRQIAERLNSTKDRLGWFRRYYRKLWDSQFKKAQDAIVKSVRAAAGTDAIMTDPDRYLMLAKQAAKITKKRGQTLFDKKEEHTLSTFFESYYIPLMDASEDAIYQYRNAVNRWTLATGDPPLSKIDSAMLADFKRFLSSLRGRKPGTLASARTVAGRLQYIQSILDKAGPPRPRNRDAAGILETVPWVRPPKVPLPLPRIVADDQLNACYQAAGKMRIPKVDGIAPADWWRTLLVVAYNTGLRFGSLFSLQMSDIDWKNNQIVIPPERMKSKRAHVLSLNATTMTHLRKIRTDREAVFPQPTHRRDFYRCLHRLQNLAGIPENDHFGLHNIRKTTATRLWENSPQAAQLALGHAGSDVTIKHYVQSGDIVKRALDALPQPSAFGG